MARHSGDEGGCGCLEPVARDRKIMPLSYLGHRLCEKLPLGVRGEHDARVVAGIEPPLHQHRDQCRLTDAVARCPRDAAWRVARGRMFEMLAYVLHDIALPVPRAMRSDGRRVGEGGVGTCR